MGILLACGSLLCQSLMVIVTRKLRKVHFALQMLVFGLVVIVHAVVMKFLVEGAFVRIPTGLYDSLLIAGVAGFSFLGQSTNILATKFEQAGLVALLRSNEVVFSFLLQFLFLGVVPDEWRLDDKNHVKPINNKSILILFLMSL